jgi:hypothetical protein
VPWYARMPFEERIEYLDWIIPIREEEDRAWRAEYAKKHGAWISKFVSGETTNRKRELYVQRRLELADREPLSMMGWAYAGGKSERIKLSQGALYRRHLDSQRWKRTRLRKLVSVGYRCEHSDCEEHATDCHHLHYYCLGLEANVDLEALCRYHHDVRHGMF